MPDTREGRSKLHTGKKMTENINETPTNVLEMTYRTHKMQTAPMRINRDKSVGVLRPSNIWNIWQWTLEKNYNSIKEHEIKYLRLHLKNRYKISMLKTIKHCWEKFRSKLKDRCARFGIKRSNIKMLILSKLTYRYNTTQIKMVAAFLEETGWSWNLYRNSRDLEEPKPLWKRKQNCKIHATWFAMKPQDSWPDGIGNGRDTEINGPE